MGSFVGASGKFSIVVSKTYVFLMVYKGFVESFVGAPGNCIHNNRAQNVLFSSWFIRVLWHRSWERPVFKISSFLNGL